MKLNVEKLKITIYGSFTLFLIGATLIVHSVVDHDRIVNSPIAKTFSPTSLCLGFDFPPVTYFAPLFFSLLAGLMTL